jgi:hypothetical protein
MEEYLGAHHAASRCRCSYAEVSIPLHPRASFSALGQSARQVPFLPLRRGAPATHSTGTGTRSTHPSRRRLAGHVEPNDNEEIARWPLALASKKGTNHRPRHSNPRAWKKAASAPKKTKHRPAIPSLHQSPRRLRFPDPTSPPPSATSDRIPSPSPPIRHPIPSSTADGDRSQPLPPSRAPTVRDLLTGHRDLISGVRFLDCRVDPGNPVPGAAGGGLSSPGGV